MVVIKSIRKTNSKKNNETETSAETTKKVAKTLKWITDDLYVFGVLEEVLITAPIQCSSNFCQEFVLNTDDSFKGLDVISFQQVDDSKLHIIAYTSWSMQPLEKSIHKL